MYDDIGNKHNLHKGEDCIIKFYESLREHAMKIINFEKKKMILLASKEYELYPNQTSYHICKKEFEENYSKDKNYCKVREH